MGWCWLSHLLLLRLQSPGLPRHRLGRGCRRLGLGLGFRCCCLELLLPGLLLGLLVLQARPGGRAYARHLPTRACAHSLVSPGCDPVYMTLRGARGAECETDLQDQVDERLRRIVFILRVVHLLLRHAHLARACPARTGLHSCQLVAKGGDASFGSGGQRGLVDDWLRGGLALQDQVDERLRRVVLLFDWCGEREGVLGKGLDLFE